MVLVGLYPSCKLKIVKSIIDTPFGCTSLDIIERGLFIMHHCSILLLHVKLTICWFQGKYGIISSTPSSDGNLNYDDLMETTQKVCNLIIPRIVQIFVSVSSLSHPLHVATENLGNDQYDFLSLCTQLFHLIYPGKAFLPETASPENTEDDGPSDEEV